MKRDVVSQGQAIRSVTVAGHFGELLQGRLGREGPIVVVSLPCPALAARVWHKPGGPLRLRFHGPATVTMDQASQFLRSLGQEPAGTFEFQLDMPPGGGAGASTASLVALARAAGIDHDPAQACCAIEGATDPLMVARPAEVLWATRQAKSVARLPPLPRFDVIGGFFGAPQTTDPTDLRFPDIARMIPHWEAAAKAGDIATLASLATASAEATLALRGPKEDVTAQWARTLGALGYVIGHTGSARGLIFAPGQIPKEAAKTLTDAGVTNLVQFAAGVR